MKKSFSKILAVLTVTLAVLIVSSCATSVRVEVTRPAELDLNGAKSISILPFRPCEYYGSYDPYRGYHLSILDFFFGFDRASRDEMECIRFLKDEIEDGLYDSQYLSLVSSESVASALKNGTEIKADVYLTGEVLYFDVFDDHKEVKRKIPPKDEDDEPTYVFEDEYTRHVDFDFRYQVVDSKTDEIISYKTIRLSNTSFREKNPRDLPSPYSMLRWDIESTAKKILKELQPYVVTKYLDLLSYKKHDAMKYADNLAKDGYIERSCEKFQEIYNQEGLFEAGYNAALLLEALGFYDEALDLIKEVSKNVSPKQSKIAYKLMYDIENEIKQADKLFKQTQDRNNISDL